MIYKRFSGFAAAVIILIVLGVLAATATTVAIAKPEVFSNFRQYLAQQYSKTSGGKNDAISKFLAEGASKDSSILVKFKDGTSPEAIKKIHEKTGLKEKKVIPKINTQVIEMSNGDRIGETINTYKSFSEVEYAEPNFIAMASLAVNDPMYSKQWGLEKISAPTAWDSTQGGGGPVAVIDTGVSASHPDLAGEVKSGYNFVNDTTDTNDDHGHGTHVSGIVAAVTNNSTGVASIGFKSSIIPVKVLNAYGSGTYSDVASGIIYAADNGAKIENMSLGGPSSSITLQNAVNYAKSKGVIIVAAAGNGGSSAPNYPAACTGVIAISATDSADNVASFSSYGKNIFAGAPGVGITSTYNNGGYTSMSGTSMASPHFAGLLELALSYGATVNPPVSGDQILDYIKQSSDKVGSIPYDGNGWNQYFGYGRINAAKLMELIKGSNPSPTPTPSVKPTTTLTSTSTSTSTPSDEPTKETTGPSHPRSPENFNVELSATIDSINDDRTIVKVKIINISQNIKLDPNDLVDLYMAPDTEIKYKGRDIAVADLKVGDKLNVKALWSENKLTARDITVQQSEGSSGGGNTNQPSSDSGKSNKGKKK